MLKGVAFFGGGVGVVGTDAGCWRGLGSNGTPETRPKPDPPGLGSVQTFAKRLRRTVAGNWSGREGVSPLGTAAPASPPALAASAPSLASFRRDLASCRAGVWSVPFWGSLSIVSPAWRRGASRRPWRRVARKFRELFRARKGRGVPWPRRGVTVSLAPPATSTSARPGPGFFSFRMGGVGTTRRKGAGRAARKRVRIPGRRVVRGNRTRLVTPGGGAGSIGTARATWGSRASPAAVSSRGRGGGGFTSSRRSAPTSARSGGALARFGSCGKGAPRRTGTSRRSSVVGPPLAEGGLGLGTGNGPVVPVTHRYALKLRLDDQSRLGGQQVEPVAEGGVARSRCDSLLSVHRTGGPRGIWGEDVLLDRFEFAGGRDIPGATGGRFQLHPPGLARTEADHGGDPSRGPGDFPAQGTAPEPPDILIDPNSRTLHRTHPSKTDLRDPESHVPMVAPPVTPQRVNAPRKRTAGQTEPRCLGTVAVGIRGWGPVGKSGGGTRRRTLKMGLDGGSTCGAGIGGTPDVACDNRRLSVIPPPSPRAPRPTPAHPPASHTAGDRPAGSPR